MSYKKHPPLENRTIILNVLLSYWTKLACIAIILFASVSISSEGIAAAWEGKLRDGTIVTNHTLREAIKLHKEWVDSNGTKGVRADFSGADLSGVDFETIHPLEEDAVAGKLVGANLANSNFAGTTLTGANLTCVNFSGANLFQANLSTANLSGANLTKANLPHVNLSKTNLGGACLYNTDLSHAQFNNTDIDGALLTNAILNYATYESVISSPSASHLGGIKGLDTLVFKTNDGYSGLILLRTAFRLSGLRESERQLTLSIEKGRLSYKNFIEKYIHILLFYLPCSYGESPLRPISILILLIPLFALLYYCSLQQADTADGLYLIWPKERVRQDIGFNAPTKLLSKGLAAAGWALYFSILSASRIGWRDLNLGSWIINMQRREYLLAATGWVRTIAGIQSLISVYLLALCLLTYFGRPFG